MSNKRALIVDDSSTAQYRLKKMLRPFNLAIDIVDSGEAALRYLASNAPDVVFMDHLMPGMDGFRALQIIKSHPETAMIPVIMYTSRSGDVYTGQARALGALDVVSKDTINAADLSKVMAAIHIYPIAEEPESPPPIESAEFVAAANQASDMEAFKIERRTASTASVEQARNLELRLSHLEHTLEDNRRFITSRVVRELQGLRQSMKQEFSDIIAAQAAPKLNAPATESVELPPTESESSGFWSWTGKLLVVLATLCVLFFLAKIATSIDDTQEQQMILGKQISSIARELKSEPDMPSPALVNATKQNNLLEQKYADDAYLADIAWAFNQSGSLSFNQNTIDPKAVIRIYELLNRLISNGFRGSAWVDVYVGNYCIGINSFGQTQLPAEGATLGDCMLSSEMYGMEQVMQDYSRELNSAFNNLSRGQVKVVNIIVSAKQGEETYPERLPTLEAQEWNEVAQRNNYIELRLESSSGY